MFDITINSQNEKNEIYKLKSDLMASGTYSESDISSALYKFKKDEEGRRLEENIIQALKIELGWTPQKLLQGTFYYRIISYDNNETIIINNNIIKEISFFGEIFIFQHQQDRTLKIYSKEGLISPLFLYKQKDYTLTLSSNKSKKIVKISVDYQAQIDGFFNISNFDVKQFNKEEVEILYINVNPTEIMNYTQAIIEIKLNQKKIPELLNQLERDKYIAEKETSQKVLYIGFVNSKIIDSDALLVNSDMKCIIIGIDNNFMNLNMLHELDWGLIEKYKAMESKIKQLESKVDLLWKKVDSLETSFNSFNSRLEKLEVIIGQIFTILTSEFGKEKSDKIFLAIKRKSPDS